MWSSFLLLLLGCSSCSSMLLPQINISIYNLPPTEAKPPGYPMDTVPLSRGAPILPPDMMWPQLSNETSGDVSMMHDPVPAVSPLPDMRICDMILNAPEPVPPDEIPSFCLCSHCKKTPGPPGDRGDQGTEGERGSPGSRGITGFQGRRGTRGHPGLKGENGDLGIRGKTGGPGFTGPKGERGSKGELGGLGDPGHFGINGARGETGSCPAHCTIGFGPPGQQGSTGMAGAQGLPGVHGDLGLPGRKGDKGNIGRPGYRGQPGPPGKEGERAICNCTAGAQGKNGPPGPKGITGDRGDTGVAGGPGQAGSKGEFGDMGFMGLPGPCSSAIQSAFSASITRSFPPADLPVAFTRVLSNQQGHFNPQSGIYTAPVNGTYILSFHLTTVHRTLTVGLFINYIPVLKTKDGRSFSTASVTVPLHLQELDQVWLQVKNELTNGIYTDGESSSTFTGYLLHPDSCKIPAHYNSLDPPVPSGVFSRDGGSPTTPSPT